MKFGTVDWLFREYKRTKAYLEKVSLRSRRDYERTMLLVTYLITKKGDRVGDRQVKAITPVSADKIYELVVAGPHGPRPRQGEKVVGLCARAWSVVHRLYPNVFNKEIPNPWRGVTKNRRTKATKPAATRDQVYAFANKAIQSAIRRLQRQRSFALSGCSVPRTFWPATSDGPITEGAKHRQRSEFFITRPARSSFTRCRTVTVRYFTPMRRTYSPKFLVAEFR